MAFVEDNELDSLICWVDKLVLIVIIEMYIVLTSLSHNVVIDQITWSFLIDG